MNGHKSPISGLSSYKNLIATAGYDNQVILWDSHEHRILASGKHKHLANQCSFNSTGTLLVSASSDYTAKIWSIPDLKEVAVLGPHNDDVEMAAFSPNGLLVATASRDHLIRVFDLKGDLVSLLQGHEADVISVCWSVKGDQIISSSDDGTVRIWDWKRTKLIETKRFDGVETDTLVVTSKGNIFAGNDEGEISIIGEAKNHECIKAHTAGIKRLVWDEKSQRLLSLSYDRKAALWLWENCRLTLIKEISLDPCVWPRSCAFVGDEQLAFASFSSSYLMYDIRTNEWEKSHAFDTDGVNAVVEFRGGVYTIGDSGVVKKDAQRFSSVGSLCNFLCPFEDALLTGGQLGIVFDALTEKSLYQHKSPLNCGVAFEYQNKKYACVGSYTGELILFKWSTKSQKAEFVKTVKVFNNAIKSVAANKEELFLVCANRDASRLNFTYLVGDQDDLRSLALVGVHDKIANGCTNVSENAFASVSRDLKLRLWTNKEAKSFDSPFKHSIKCVTSNGKHIVAGAYDGTLAVFDVSKERWVKAFKPTQCGISNLTCNGETFRASSYDGNVYSFSEQ